jgi:hypothetical protein
VTPQTPYCKASATTGVLQETVRHAFSGQASLSIGAGIAVATIVPVGVEGVPDSIPDELTILPYASATFLYRLDYRNTLLLAAQVLPTVDIRTGLPSERAQTVLTLTDALTQDLSVIATASVVQSIPIQAVDPYTITLLTGNIELRRRIDRQLSALVGLTGLWQSQVGYADVASVVAYVGVTARLPPTRF